MPGALNLTRRDDYAQHSVSQAISYGRAALLLASHFASFWSDSPVTGDFAGPLRGFHRGLFRQLAPASIMLPEGS